MTEIDLKALAESVAKEEGVDPDFREYEQTARMIDGIKIYKEVEYLDGTSETLQYDISTTPEMLTDADSDPEVVLRHELETAMRSIKERGSEEMEINGHRLRFYMQDSFHAWCLETGRQWSARPEDYEHTPPLRFPDPEDQPNPLAEAHVFDDVEGIPYHVKEKLMMYVIGWALEYSPDEWFDEMAKAHHPSELP